MWKHYFKLLEAEATSLSLNLDNLPSPIEVLNNIETKSKSLAIKSLKAGLTDLFLMYHLYIKEDLKKLIDLDLNDNGLPGYFKVYGKIKSNLQSILKRGFLKSLEEFYFVTEILSDTTADFTTDERAILNNCLSQFEQKSRL
jgi:hypothetical protein